MTLFVGKLKVWVAWTGIQVGVPVHMVFAKNATSVRSELEPVSETVPVAWFVVADPMILRTAEGIVMSLNKVASCGPVLRAPEVISTEIGYDPLDKGVCI